MPNLFLYFFFFIISLYFLHAMLLLWGSFRHRPSRTDITPTVTVVVPARDEEKNIHECLQSLARLSYPKEKLEITIVNDRSKDRTEEIAAEFIGENDNFKLINIAQDPVGLAGKANAISMGIQRSFGEIILLTDADCRVLPTWVESIISHFKSDVGLVAGFTLLDQKKDRAPLFTKIQSLDWIYLLTIATGAAGIGKPVSCIGNNLAFRRTAYREIGGYQGIGFTVTEDFAFLKAIVDKTPWKIVFTMDPRSVVRSKPPESFRQFYQQRKRWTIGGRTVRPLGLFLMTLSFITHLLIPMSFFLMKNLLAPLWTILTIFISDFLILLCTTSALKRTDLLKYFFFFEAFYFFYTALFSFSFFRGRVKWKGIEYR